jgi:hypothetical protein
MRNLANCAVHFPKIRPTLQESVQLENFVSKLPFCGRNTENERATSDLRPQFAKLRAKSQDRMRNLANCAVHYPKIRPTSQESVQLENFVSKLPSCDRKTENERATSDLRSQFAKLYAKFQMYALTFTVGA